MLEDNAFNLIVGTSDAISLVHRFVDHFIGHHDDDKFCAVAVVGRDGKVLASACMRGCPDNLLHLATTQARSAIKGLEVRCIDKMNGKGPIRGHFGSVALLDRRLYVGFYVRLMTADVAAEIIKGIALQRD